MIMLLTGAFENVKKMVYWSCGWEEITYGIRNRPYLKLKEGY